MGKGVGKGHRMAWESGADDTMELGVWMLQVKWGWEHLDDDTMGKNRYLDKRVINQC